MRSNDAVLNSRERELYSDTTLVRNMFYSLLQKIFLEQFTANVIL